ncbi:FxsA family protein [Imhoffiella purpurea]|uniref:FxsA cytoplasmic membrane protein n=1 Tax=Imhoffiella purpurea TaxID=1249627 RepID=W9W254_9GAMM|nr:FxsA family protein [Imhoffiella purpurea]EXJ16665.1 FxsA cytoplasmic membrane protein [Imhoffiella purpurea]
MPLIILSLFIGLPLIELYFLIQVGDEIGALPTIALSILTAIIGTWLVRLQGFGLLMRVREVMDRGEVPALEMLDGALILVAGLFLLLPGFLTDGLGFLLLVPPFRRWMVSRFVRVVPAQGHPGQPAGQGPRVIEGDYRRED